MALSRVAMRIKCNDKGKASHTDLPRANDKYVFLLVLKTRLFIYFV